MGKKKRGILTRFSPVYSHMNNIDPLVQFRQPSFSKQGHLYQFYVKTQMKLNMIVK